MSVIYSCIPCFLILAVASAYSFHTGNVHQKNGGRSAPVSLHLTASGGQRCRRLTICGQRLAAKAGGQQLAAICWWPMAGGQRLVANGWWPKAGGQRLVAKGWWPKAGGQKLATNGWWPTAGGQRLVANGWRPTAGGQRLAANVWCATATGEQLAANSQPHYFVTCSLNYGLKIAFSKR
jgi:hypothetical protein